MLPAKARYIAHIRDKDKCRQSVAEHNDHVAKLSEAHGAAYGIGSLALFTGRHHDDGKNTQAFYTYIKASSEEKTSPVVQSYFLLMERS